MGEKDNDRAIEESEELLKKIGAAGKPPDILIVDDVKANIFLMESILEGMFSYESFQSAESMWRRLKRGQPKLILLDLMMPFEDGFSILEKLKSDPKYNSIKVIVVSAKDSKEDVVKALRLGAGDYIVKPVKEKILINKIISVLNLNPDEIFSGDEKK